MALTPGKFCFVGGVVFFLWLLFFWFLIFCVFPVCVCVCVRVRVCVCACVCVVRLYQRPTTAPCVCARERVCVRVSVRACVCSRVLVCACVCVCVFFVCLYNLLKFEFRRGEMSQIMKS